MITDYIMYYIMHEIMHYIMHDINISIIRLNYNQLILSQTLSPWPKVKQRREVFWRFTTPLDVLNMIWFKLCYHHL